MAKYSTNKDLNVFIRRLIDQGWRVEHSTHTKLHSPDGFFVSISTTPSCPYVVEKIKRDIRRMQRQKRER